jgi:meiotically up-regulated gene 157 (Mug157) protein
MIHESFNKDTQYSFTRSEFGWANSLFAEFVMFVDKNYPDIIKQI